MDEEITEELKKIRKDMEEIERPNNSIQYGENSKGNAYIKSIKVYADEPEEMKKKLEAFIEIGKNAILKANQTE